MENASKALLMAGGIFIGVILLSGLLILWANISKTQAIDTGEKDKQLADFNMEFETYNKENLYGSEIISLMNKINTYNDNPPEFFNSKVQYEKISLIVDFTHSTFDLNELGITNGSEKNVDLTENKGTATKKGSSGKVLEKFTNAEAELGKSFLNKLSANITKFETLTAPSGEPGGLRENLWI